MAASLFFYSVAWICASVLSLIGYRRCRRIYIGNGYSPDYKRKIGYLSIIIISLLFVAYNYYITTQSNGALGNDRLNYTAYFNGSRAFTNPGLGYVMALVQRAGGTIDTVFYVTTFICVVITLVAYKYSEDASPAALVLLFLSQYIMISFTALKQAYTNAFACLFFAVMLNTRVSRSKNIIAIICIALAILFHPAGIILIPFFFFLRGEKKKITIAAFIISLVIIAVFMRPLMNILSVFLRPILPSLSAHISSYFSETRSVVRQTSAFAFIKGFPCYVISSLGLIRRKHLKSCINNYDNYLIVSIVCGFFYLVGTYNAWFFRFSYLLFLPTFIFFGLLIRNTKLAGNRIIIQVIVYLSMLLVTYREIALVYTNWGGVW